LNEQRRNIAKSKSKSDRMAEEATINSDGTQTFEDFVPPVDDAGAGDEPLMMDEETMDEIVKAGIDPALILGAVVLLFAVIYFFFLRKKKDQEDEFFADLDGDKFNLKLPEAVEEYYEIKSKCEQAGWAPGVPPPGGQNANPNGPHRILAQALMKRCIADIPIVTHIQKEATGMNKLYSQSMCSVKQWRSYQAAEALVSVEVDEVRAEADEIEPGWSQVIWRQAMQYHQMLKQKHEQESKEAAEAAAKKKAIAAKVDTAKDTEKKVVVDKEAEIRAAELAAELAAQELIKADEREKKAKKAFSDGGMKKGFLAGK